MTETFTNISLYLKTFIYSVISCDPPCKNGNSRFTTVPLKPKPSKTLEEIVVFSDSKSAHFCEFLHCFLQAKCASDPFRENANENQPLKKQNI